MKRDDLGGGDAPGSDPGASGADTPACRSAELRKQSATSKPCRTSIAAELLRMADSREAQQAAKARKLEAEHHRQWYATRQEKRRAR